MGRVHAVEAGLEEVSADQGNVGRDADVALRLGDGDVFVLLGSGADVGEEGLGEGEVLRRHRLGVRRLVHRRL